MMQTLLLDQTTWDLLVDSGGNIAVASEPYAIAQDVASACRTFLAELWYDATQGVPYQQQVLGQLPTIDDLKSMLIAQAMNVTGVVSATCLIQSFVDRQISGQLQFTDTSGQTQTLELQ